MKILLPFAILFLAAGISFGQDRADRLEDAEDAKAAFLKEDPGLKEFFEKAYGYAIFPNVGKGAVGVGGAGGKGVLFEAGQPIGEVKLSQVTVGLQLGGQSYREVVFFETREVFKAFKRGKTKLSLQVSAVAAADGASADAPYREGVAIFTLSIGGLMYEASVGGQKFKFKKW